MRRLALVLAVASLVGSGQAVAQPAKPSAAAKPAPTNLPSQAQPQTPLPTLNIIVSDRDRNTTLEFYRSELAAGRCPAPMVRHKQACGAPDKRPWKLDQALADDVKLTPPPGALIMKLSASPAGYQYMCLGRDILLVGVGTRVVAAWVADVSRL